MWKYICPLMKVHFSLQEWLPKGSTCDLIAVNGLTGNKMAKICTEQSFPSQRSAFTPEPAIEWIERGERSEEMPQTYAICFEQFSHSVHVWLPFNSKYLIWYIFLICSDQPPRGLMGRWFDFLLCWKFEDCLCIKSYFNKFVPSLSGCPISSWGLEEDPPNVKLQNAVIQLW